MSFVEKFKHLQSSQPVSTEHDNALAKLQEIVHGLKEIFDENEEKLTFVLEPGFMTNYGLQYKICVTYSGDKKDVLFRAYVPMSGYPVALDLDGENAEVCKNEAALEDTLARFFANTQVGVRVHALKKL